MSIRAFIVVDHELMRAGLRAVLDREGDIEVVGEAGTAVDARRGLDRCRPDVALIDPLLPDGDGLHVCREASGASPSVRCLVLARRADDEMLASAIRAGATGFLLTNAAVEEIVRSVRVSCRRSSTNSATKPASPPGMSSRCRTRAMSASSSGSRGAPRRADS